MTTGATCVTGRGCSWHSMVTVRITRGIRGGGSIRTRVVGIDLRLGGITLVVGTASSWVAVPLTAEASLVLCGHRRLHAARKRRPCASSVTALNM